MPFLPPNQQRQSLLTCDKLRAIIMSYLSMLVKVMFLPTVLVCLVKLLQQREICTSYYGSSVWFRLRRAIVTYERDTTALRVPVGEPGLDRSCS